MPRTPTPIPTSPPVTTGPTATTATPAIEERTDTQHGENEERGHQNEERAQPRKNEELEHNNLYDSVPTATTEPTASTTPTAPTPRTPTPIPTSPPVTTGPTATTATPAIEERTDTQHGENEEQGHQNEERAQPRKNEELEQTRLSTVNAGKNEEREQTRLSTVNAADNANGKEERTTVEHRAELQSTLRAKRKSLHNKSDYTYRYGFAQIEKSIEAAAQAIKQLRDFSAGNESLQLPSIQRAMHGLMFTQMSAQKGIKKHGQAAYDALRKEFEQLKVMQVLEPLDTFKLAKEQKSESLRALSVIKEKRDGRLKGRTVADGSAQRGKFSKAETGSPTAASDAVLLTAIVDAHEGRDIAIADVTGAYLHAHMKDFISMRFTGWAVDLLCDVNPEYAAHAVYEGKTKALYVRCNKAIYGCVVSGMLWYELFSHTLEHHGFTINPYDFCVANATIKGTQCTIVWYVDDTKISGHESHRHARKPFRKNDCVPRLATRIPRNAS
jgi:Reverse transcriptase (RNA-dependent DNA polymerase)